MSQPSPTDNAAVASALGMNDPAAEVDEQTQDAEATPDDEQEVDWKTEAEKWKTEARKHERRAKENAAAQRELQKLRASNGAQAPNDTAVAEAKESGRKEARDEYGQRLAAAEIRAALTGVVTEPNDVIEDLALSRYVTDEGEVDEDAVKALREKYQSLLGKKPVARVSHGRGQNGIGPTQKSTGDQFADALSGLLG